MYAQASDYVTKGVVRGLFTLSPLDGPYDLMKNTGKMILQGVTYKIL